MVEVNATLFIQMINFFVVWWALDQFFFRHVVGLISRERARVKRLDNSIKRENALLEAELDRQKVEWHKYRRKFKKHTPKVETLPLLSYSAILCEISGQEDHTTKELLVQEVKRLIITKVTRYE